MVEQHAREATSHLPLGAVRTHALPRGSARLAQGMAHENPKRRRLPRPDGYAFKDSWSPGRIRLFERFLAAVREQCPEVVTAWKALLPLADAAIKLLPGDYYSESGIVKYRKGVEDPDSDETVLRYRRALNAWAEEYGLDAPWLLHSLHAAYEQVVNVGGPLRWPRGFSTDLYYTPTVRGFTFEVPDSEPGEDFASYKRRVTVDFRSVLAQRVRAAAASFETDPQLERVPQASDTVLSAAVLWQVRGERPIGDREAVRQLLKRLMLEPRRGL